MIRCRVVPALAVLALVACKKGDDKPKPGVASGTGSAPAPAPADAASAVVAPTPTPGSPITQPFFYQVEKDGKVSWLLGTWHLGIDAQKQLPKVVWDKLGTAKVFAMEADPTDPAALSAFKRNDGKTLEAELGPEYWAKLETLLDPGDEPNVQIMKISAAIMFLQFKSLPQTPAMDLALATKARDAKAKIVFLEPIATQLALIDKWLDARMMHGLLDDPATGKREIQEALVAYVAGDDAELANRLVDRESMKKAGFNDAEIEAATKELIYDRNAAWIPTLDGLFAKGDAFVAVGAGHLVGPKSVVELLTTKGYKVTRVAP